jgi:hypothetical protein
MLFPNGVSKVGGRTVSGSGFLGGTDVPFSLASNLIAFLGLSSWSHPSGSLLSKSGACPSSMHDARFLGRRAGFSAALGAVVADVSCAVEFVVGGTSSSSSSDFWSMLSGPARADRLCAFVFVMDVFVSGYTR